MNYIVYEDGRLKVARSHQYCCHFAMYVTNVLVFVYSRKRSIIVVVERDEGFLRANIPKLESFFYSFYTKHLMK